MSLRTMSLILVLALLCHCRASLSLHFPGDVQDVDSVASARWSLRADVYRTVDALERLVQFLVMHEQDLTLDHALGAVIAQGQVSSVVGALEASGPRGEERARLSKRLRDVDADLDSVMRAASRNRDRRLPDSRAKTLLLQPWLWRASSGRRVLDEHPVPDPRGAAAEPSAQTMLELRELLALGTGTPSEAQSGRCLDAVLAASCRIPDDCLRAETGGATSGYATTHRLLFYHVADRVGCRVPGPGPEEVIAHLCRHVLREANEIARAAFPALLRDLFAEQVALCGMRGYAAFAKPAWLDEILSWQRPAGCFGNYTELQEAAQPFRELRGNAHLDDLLGLDCLSHLTGVVAASIAFNLRELVHRWEDH